jgi:hypothetical protein
MNRCTHRLMAVLILTAAAAGLVTTPIAAQTDDAPLKVREFPKAALRGEMTVLAPPEIFLNGKADRLSVGARIRDANNHFVLPGPLTNQTLVVNYLRDNIGQVQQVWILNAEEAREKRAGSADTVFNFITGTAAAPADDGKTPYTQLPAYKQ